MLGRIIERNTKKGIVITAFTMSLTVTTAIRLTFYESTREIGFSPRHYFLTLLAINTIDSTSSK